MTVSASSRFMVTRHPGACATCRVPFVRGAVVLWDPADRRTFCADCGERELAAMFDAANRRADILRRARREGRI